MATKRVCFVLLIAVLALPALATTPSAGAQENATTTSYAEAGPYPVGKMDLEDEAPLHKAKIVVWYPAVYPEGKTPKPGLALKNAAPDPSGGPYPLVIFVPGLWADRFTGQWLGSHLPSYGFVAMAMDPIDVTGSGYTEGAGMLRRPQELVWQLDYAASMTAEGGPLEGLIDMEHVAVTGHSYGGYTALVAGGARLDWSFRPTWCSAHYESEDSIDFGNFCDWLANTQALLAPLAGLDATEAGLWPSWGDARVDAIVPIAPPFWIAFGPEGMGSINVPMLLIGGAKDTTVPPDWDLFYENAGSDQKALVLFEKGDHVSIYGATTPSKGLITAFLLAMLKGDADAAAALAPDAVSFPDVTYEAQGF